MLSRIRSRIDVRSPLGEQQAHRFTVTITIDGARVIGTITSQSALGEPSARALAADDCKDAVDALALIAAMTLHPELRETEAQTNVIALAPGTPEVNPQVQGIPSSPTQPTGERKGSREHVESAGDALEPRDESARRLRLLGSGDAEVTFGYVPEVLLGTTARLTLADVSGRVVNSAYAVGVSALRPNERRVAEGAATLTWTLGQLTACPVHFGLSRSMSLLPCGRVDVGRVSAVGQDIVGARTRNLIWVDAGVLAEFSWILAPPLVVSWEGAVRFPLTPYDFFFEPNSLIYGAPWVGLSTALGLGIIFL
jgi:hypothetical protein